MFVGSAALYYGVRSLVVDKDFARPGELEALAGLARPAAASGPLVRYDVWP